jgi:hypothetical protein
MKYIKKKYQYKEEFTLNSGFAYINIIEIEDESEIPNIFNYIDVDMTYIGSVIKGLPEEIHTEIGFLTEKEKNKVALWYGVDIDMLQRVVKGNVSHNMDDVSYQIKIEERRNKIKRILK